MEEFEITDALIAIGFGVFVLAVVVPLIGVMLLSVLDVAFRQDIGFSRLVWLLMVLLVPVGGVLMYWLLRPKDFDPLRETGGEPAYYAFPTYAAARSGRAVPAIAETPTPIQAPAAIATQEPPEEKAA